MEAAAILKQMRAAGMKQRVFGAFRTLGDTLLKEAGDAAEGFEAVYPYDPNRNDPHWIDFNRRFENRFREKPEQFAAMAYDTMNLLLDSICKAGLNRARIHDALANVEEYDGVTGHMVFDPNLKNTAPLYLGTVHNGAITYRVALMEKTPAVALAPATPQCHLSRQPAPAAMQSPYARVGEVGVDDAGPHRKEALAGPVSIVIFGPKATAVVATPEMQAEIASSAIKGRELKLLAVESDQDLGAASTALVKALMDDHALAILALDRNSGHLAEQTALKSVVPVVALAADKTLASTNMSWMFRLQPDTTPATALRMLVAAECRSGANPERLRKVLASAEGISGVSLVTTGEPPKQ